LIFSGIIGRELFISAEKYTFVNKKVTEMVGKLQANEREL